MAPTLTDLQRHAREIAAAFNVRLVEDARIRHEEALGIPHLRVVLMGAIVDETTYAVALHEIGHLCSPTGVVRHVISGNRADALLVEEDAAWTWARHYALEWTPAMEQLACWAVSTYEQARDAARETAAPRRAPEPEPEPQAPSTPINWNDWR